MNEREFCYWLQGLIEIGGVRPLEAREVQIIADHLSLVFKKVTPTPYQGLQPFNPFAQEYIARKTAAESVGSPIRTVATC